MIVKNDVYFMRKAIECANKAAEIGEAPIGAVIVKDGIIISRAYNKREIKKNALYHAEILAIDKACKKLNTFRLNDCVMYVTLEPCPMCAGAIINARLKKVVFGAYDPKRGCVGSIYNLLEDKRFNHNPQVQGGIMEKECSQLLSDFFSKKRLENKENASQN